MVISRLPHCLSLMQTALERTKACDTMLVWDAQLAVAVVAKDVYVRGA